MIDRIQSSGKRDALARSLKIIARQAPTRHDIVIFVEGNTCVPLDMVVESAPWFTNRNIGALTTDEGVIIEKKNLFRDWFILRFNQRQVMIGSMGLSNRVLTLTGRMSAFRADLAIDPGFINGIGHDFLDHWLLGRVTYLTGDDKSTWFWLLCAPGRWRRSPCISVRSPAPWSRPMSCSAWIGRNGRASPRRVVRVASAFGRG